MTPIPPLDRTSPSFRAEVDTFFSSRIPAFVTEINALATDLTTKQGLATQAAADADADRIVVAADKGTTKDYKDVAQFAADKALEYRNTAKNHADAAAAAATTIGTAAAFSDANPIVKGNVDPSKQVKIECDTNIPTGTTVTLTAPAISGPLALLGDIDVRPKAFFDAGAAVALDFNSGVHQRWAPGTGAKTLTISNWPASGHAELMIEGIGLGAATITWPSYINWIRYDGTYSTSFSYLGIGLQGGSQSDFIILWSRAGSTQVFGKVVR